MDKPNKDDKELVAQLERLGVHVVELEEQLRAVPGMIAEQKSIQHALGERVKELNCLYGISEAVERYGNSLDEVLQGIVRVLPESWQYPEITCASIVLKEREYTTPRFERSAWGQTAGFQVSGEEAGMVEVYYLAAMPTLDEGPFLKEERLLINAVAERTGKIIERINTTQELLLKQSALEQSNIAMHQLMARIQEQKAEIGTSVQGNIDKIILPIVDTLERTASAQQRAYLNFLRRNLDEIASPFANRLSKAFMTLTPAEIRICNMVRRDLTTKEIARLQSVSATTVGHHREHIRRKLGLTNTKVNLITYLNSLMSKQAE